MSHSKHRLNHRDQQFAALARRKDPEALNVLWEFRARLVLSIRRKFGAYIPFEDCEDLATTTVVEAYERGSTFNPAKSSLPTWLNVLAHYHALNFLRKHNCEFPLPVESLAELPAAEVLQAERAAREVPSAYIQQALVQLPAVWARAIRLFYYEGRSISLIASEMQIAESTVRCYLARGISQLGMILSMAEAESDE